MSTLGAVASTLCALFLPCGSLAATWTPDLGAVARAAAALAAVPVFGGSSPVRSMCRESQRFVRVGYTCGTTVGALGLLVAETADREEAPKTRASEVLGRVLAMMDLRREPPTAAQTAPTAELEDAGADRCPPLGGEILGIRAVAELEEEPVALGVLGEGGGGNAEGEHGLSAILLRFCALTPARASRIRAGRRDGGGSGTLSASAWVLPT